MDRKRRIGRETVGAVLLISLLLGGLFSSWQMGKIHTRISRELEEAAWFALAGDWAGARRNAISAENRWVEHRDVTSLLADHTPMEQIDALFARAGILSAAREGALFAAVCSELSRYVEAMGDAHRLSWENLL